VSRDQAIGAALMAGSLAGIAIYGWLLTSPYYLLILQITAFVAVAGVLGILAWIGYTLATTPPPKPIEEIEKEIYRLLEEHGPMPLSALWRKLNCHLWEVSAALRRLKSKGLIEEGETSPESYRKSEV